MGFEVKDDRKSKILYVLKVLWEDTDEEHPMSAVLMASKLKEYGIECERRSILHCFDSLEEFGFDIIRTKKGTYLGERVLELPELKLLVDAVQSSKFITTGKSANLIAHLSELASLHDRKYLKRQVYVNGRVKTMNESIYYNIDTIEESMRNNEQISFQYYNWNVDKKMVPRHEGRIYRVSPWSLVWDRERYYMVAYDTSSEQIRHYRVDKMGNINNLDRKREGKKLFDSIDMANYTSLNFGMFQGDKQTVQLEAEEDMAGVIIDHFGPSVWMHIAGEGKISVSVDVAVSNQFFGWVTAMAGKVRIVSPKSVKAEYNELLRKCII